MGFLNKIVSGGQTGADRAALDFAINFNIPHGGWISKGRRTEAGPLPDVYNLKEMDSTDYPARTRQNILDSDGTVIIARGPLTGGSALTHEFALRTGKNVCSINLLEQDTFEASLILHDFLLDQGIHVLNVAGPRASHDPDIYYDVKTILTTALYLDFLETQENEIQEELWQTDQMIDQHFDFPKDFTSIKQATDALEQSLTLRGKILIARSQTCQMADIYFTFLEYVRSSLSLDEYNSNLFKFLSKGRTLKEYTPEDAVMDLLKELKNQLSPQFKLRVVSS
ncbi:putative molybdenum carrier protein [uncultured Desulfobacter sp.]|uniref:putative molybdenum carrier protein n=1 Tax=uncultured Desulfobacter sp. TaxID=240139 RepID=UPI002AAA9F2A|nr:putative molybdenum carrier protein [uncultured Desulfobacter sp.]